LGNKASGDERGASLVELAFALPLLIMLLVGMVSAGIAYNHQLTNFTTEPDAMIAWLDEVASQVEGDATGTLGAGVPGHYICVAYVHPDGAEPTDETASRVDSAGDVSYPSQPCFNDGRPIDEPRVQVVVGRDVAFNVVFWSTDLTLDSEAVNRFEAGMGF
jgi:hypothetical protein